jgi:hypothetical protein
VAVMNRVKLPPAMEEASTAYGALNTEIDDVIRTMQNWPEVEERVTAWANSLTSTNCSWNEYGLARMLMERWQRDQRRQGQS